MTEEIVERLRKIVLEESFEAARLEWMDAQPDSETPIYNYRFDHVSEVVRISTHIANRVDADLQVVTMAAWLHDIAKPGVGEVKAHGVKGAKRARTILLKEGSDSVVINRVCEAIEKHVGLTLEAQLTPLEAQVLWEADKIVKLGAIGIVHYLVNGIRINPGADLAAIAKQIEEFIPLAERIAASMYTEPGSALAQKRLGSLKRFARSLIGELELEA